MSDTTKKEVDLNYLLEYSKKENILNEKLLYIDENNSTAPEEDVSTVNSYTMTEETALKGVFYDSSKAQYWIEIFRYLFLGNRINIIYPLHFRKNVKFIRKIFYIFFFVSMSIFLLWGAIIFLMIGTTGDIIISNNKTVTPTVEMIILTPDYIDIEYNFTVTPTPVPIPVSLPPKKHIIRPVPKAVSPVRILPPRR